MSRLVTITAVSLLLLSCVLIFPADADTYGNRIPELYFVTTGQGDTDLGPGDDPWETGSYDLALLQAGISNFNVITYTSVLPPESKEISFEEAKKYFHHGAVIETIMASVNGVKGEVLCTGVGRIQVRRKSDGKHIGGFAAEYEKVYKVGATLDKDDAEVKARQMLRVSLAGEFGRRYSADEYEYFDEVITINCFMAEKSFASSITALCWVSYIYPELER